MPNRSGTPGLWHAEGGYPNPRDGQETRCACHFTGVATRPATIDHDPFNTFACQPHATARRRADADRGGARAAYQVGVLQAIADLRRACGAQAAPNPFPIIGGTSAGAINAAALACGADDFDDAVRRIVEVWHNFSAHQVYRVDPVSMLRSGANWMTLLSLGWLIARWRRLKPKSLLDNSPLAQLLTQLVPLERIPRLIQSGHLQALAVTASSATAPVNTSLFLRGTSA
jgi:NTE family protein